MHAACGILYRRAGDGINKKKMIQKRARLTTFFSSKRKILDVAPGSHVGKEVLNRGRCKSHHVRRAPPTKVDILSPPVTCRGLVHAYWAPNVWAVYLFLDRALLASLKLAGLVAASDGKGSTTGASWTLFTYTRLFSYLAVVAIGVVHVAVVDNCCCSCCYCLSLC